MDFDESHCLNKKRRYLAEWLSRFAIAHNKVRPEVQKNLDMTDWEIEALTNLTNTSMESLPKELDRSFERDYKYIKQNIPMMPDFSTIASSTATSMATAGTSGVYNFVAKFGDVGTRDVRDSVRKYTHRYRELQEAQERPERVRQLMEKYVRPNTLKRFDKAKNAYCTAKSDVSSHEQAALFMRNLLDGVKGDLFQLARSKDKEDMTWEKMTIKLTKGVINGPEYQELLAQETYRATLFSRLSDVLKDREAMSKNNIDNLWTQVLDHIHTILGLLK